MNSNTFHTSFEVNSGRPHQEKQFNGDQQGNATQNDNNTSVSVASSAEERVWLNIHVCQILLSVYSIPVLCEITNEDISINRVRTAILNVIRKHALFRTSLNYNNEEKCLKQSFKFTSSVIDVNHDDYYSFQFTRVSTTEEFDQIVEFETNGNHFNIETGIVLKCHIVKYNSKSDDMLDTGDYIIFNFHRVAVDRLSIKSFFKDLQDAYMDTLESITNMVSYLDYATKEKQILNDHPLDLTINEGRKYWHNMLRDFDATKLIPLPYDHPEKLSEKRSTMEGNSSIELTEILTENIIKFSMDCNVSMFQLLLTCYSLFLHKITHENDICIGGLNASHPNSKFVNVIGTFINIVPYRSSFIDSRTNFKDLVEKMKKEWVDTHKYSYLPFQEIMKLVRSNTSENSQIQQFPQTLFTYENTQDTPIKLLDTKCKIYNDNDILRSRNTGQIDLTLSLKTNISRVTNKLCLFGSFEYSCDLFELGTIAIMTDRFRLLLEQLFLPTKLSLSFDIEKQPICELSLLLPEEIELIQNINDTYTDFGGIQCIHQEFVRHAMEHPQKLCIHLDDQSLTYSETLYYVQRLSMHLLNEFNIRVGDSICQCVERSIEMVIGAFAIITSGAVYCPLNPNDAVERLQMLIRDTHSQLVLTHSQTNDKFNTYLDIEQFLLNEHAGKDSFALDVLSKVNVIVDNIVYVIFTSGSTGTPKAVRIRHSNFKSYADAMCYLNLFSSTDNIIQLAQCSFDVHMEELLSPMTIGAALIMLHPNGHLDLDYLSRVMQDKQVT
ncbi:unnamed protein product [Didymodactylos carnosus]|uniref:Uncharacterized protein n=1 Tax=Didymodactylos carnosus TaxID=1234261 RepID=A0A815S017_9BILA|nr:unnamed protein product [Didymodactylos carnosus]CAF4348601.1 unnamed protein product [Didymodactylos carnosus]